MDGKERCIDDEIPFEIPENWAWTRLGCIAHLINGRAYKQSELLQMGKYPVLRVGNLFTNSRWYYSDIELEEEKYAINGDLLYAWSASFGPHIWQGDKVIFHYHIWRVILSTLMHKLFFYYLLMAETEVIKSNAHGTSMIHVTKEGMEQLLIPIPPVKEQQAIVERIELLYKTFNFVTNQ